MKFKYLSFVVLATFVSFNSFSQSDTLWPAEYRQSAIGIKAQPFIEYNGMLSTESTNLNTSLLLKLRTAKTYDQTLKDEIFATLGDGLQLGAVVNNDLRFAYRGHRNRYLIPFAKRSIAIFHRGQTALSASDDLVRLILNGNKSTAGTPQDLSDFAYEDWLYSGLQFQFAFLVDTLPVSIGASLILGHSYQSASSGTTSLFTAENGSEIRFDGSFSYDDVNRPYLLGIAGVGLAIDFETQERWAKHEFKFKAQDLGFIYFTQGTRSEVDSSFSFSGINVANILSLEESVFQASLDSTSDFLGEAGEVDNMRVMPFMLQVEYEYHLQHGALKSIYLQSRYRNLVSYLPRVEIGARWKLSKKQHIGSGFNIGGFNTWGLSVTYTREIEKYWHLGLGLSHLNTIAIQSLAGGSAGFMSLRYYL
jgi:hypothetical protein